MSVSSLNRNVKKLSCKYIGSTDTSGNHSCSCTIDTGIRSLGTAKAEFHHTTTVSCVDHPGCLSGNQTLVIDDRQQSSLYKLSFHNRSNHLYQWLSWEDHSSFRDSINITAKMEVS